VTERVRRNPLAPISAGDQVKAIVRVGSRSRQCETVTVLEKPTDQARQVVVRAQLEARAMGHADVGSAHLLLGLVQDEEGIAGAVLADAKITLESARDLVRKRLGAGSPSVPDGPLSFSSSSREVFASALRVAFALGADEVGSEHLLMAIVRLRDQDAAQILHALGADLDLIRFEIKRQVMPPRDRHERGSSVLGRSVPLSQTPWGPDAPIEPGSPDRYTR
jgi:ATP-dependent Clp protease ATP-binding subunit ClpC